MLDLRAYPTVEQIRAAVSDQQRAQIQAEIAAGLRCPHGQRDPYADCSPCSRAISAPPQSGLCRHGRAWVTCPKCSAES